MEHPPDKASAYTPVSTRHERGGVLKLVGWRRGDSLVLNGDLVTEFIRKGIEIVSIRG
jgi:hypothetical protein